MSHVEYSQIECYWNDEKLIINEDIRHIKRANVFIFFEIIDFLVDLDSIEQYGKRYILSFGIFRIVIYLYYIVHISMLTCESRREKWLVSNMLGIFAAG